MIYTSLILPLSVFDIILSHKKGPPPYHLAVVWDIFSIIFLYKEKYMMIYDNEKKHNYFIITFHITTDIYREKYELTIDHAKDRCEDLALHFIIKVPS